MSILIHKATPADASAILEYLKIVGSETNNLTFGAEGVPFAPEEEAAYLANIEHSSDDVMLLAKENEKIIGVASLNRMPRRMAHRGDFSVSVLKEYWNQGIGSLLLEEILQFAKDNGFQILDLQVRSDNVGAVHLYEKYGFERIGTHPAFFNMQNEDVSFDYMILRV